MNIPWELIIGWISDLIEQCSSKGRSDTEIRQALTNPGGREYAGLWVKMGRNGVRGSERRAYMAAVRNAAGKVTGELIDELIAEAKEAG